MEIKKAIEAAEKEDKIKEIIKNGGFLSSGFATLNMDEKIEKWTLSYYDPKIEKITSVSVSENSAEPGVTDKPLHKKVQKPDKNKIKIKAEKALETAKKELKKYKKPVEKILISFQKREKEIWNIAFVTKLGSIINIKIDAQNGKIIKSDITELFHRPSVAY